MLLWCSYDSRFQEKTDKPPFYKEYWTIFKELRNLYNCDNGHDLILSNNSEVLLEGNSFFSRNWRDKGVITVQDILNDNRIPLTLYTLTSLCNLYIPWGSDGENLFNNLLNKSFVSWRSFLLFSGPLWVILGWYFMLPTLRGQRIITWRQIQDQIKFLKLFQFVSAVSKHLLRKAIKLSRPESSTAVKASLIFSALTHSINFDL